MIPRHFYPVSRYVALNNFRLVSTCSNNLKDNKGGDDHENNPASKLNALLLSVIKEDKHESLERNVRIPKPRSFHRMKKEKKVDDSSKNLGSRIVSAAKVVASNVDGDSKEVEAQLLHKLLYKDSPIKEQILKASGDNEKLTNLISEMNVEKESSTPSTDQRSSKEFSEATRAKPFIAKRRYNEIKNKIPRREKRVNLFGEEPLGIFTKECVNEGVILKTWQSCDDREKNLSVTHPPSNYYEQMIDWTEKGVIWKFPIDNEQGLEAERNVSFASHVLLESHLEGWCPTAGPIRHFMELVCVGLSRNYWLNVDEKAQHIQWYREFFSQRSKLIKEIGAGDIPLASEKSV